MLLILLILILALGVFVVLTYNRLIGLIEAVRNNEKQIDIQLDRRYKVFQSLIEVVKKYMDYEQSTLKQVVALRSKSEQDKSSGNMAGRVESENKISGILSGLNVVFEQYPDLKANQNALQFQEQIVNTENKLAFSKQAYNDSIETYNAKKKSFFESLIVQYFKSKLDFMFTYWHIEQDQVKNMEDYRVSLDDTSTSQ